MLPKLVSSYIEPLIQNEKDFYKIDQPLNPNSKTTSTIDQAKKLLKDYWEI